MRTLEAYTRKVLDLIDHARRPDGHTLIAIAGPPGSGKSTLAAEVVDRLNARGGSREIAQLVPMDGYHFENGVLDARGLRAFKGAPETFDVEGFIALLRCVRRGGVDIRYPLFNRTEDRTLPGAACVRAGTPIVVVEGNYLLLRRGGWEALKPLFDATVMLKPSMEVLERRLVARWLGCGLSRDDAWGRVRDNDLVNARTVIYNSSAADLRLGEADGADGFDVEQPARSRFT